jgi:hypothetical protein
VQCETPGVLKILLKQIPVPLLTNNTGQGDMGRTLKTHSSQGLAFVVGENTQQRQAHRLDTERGRPTKAVITKQKLILRTDSQFFAKPLLLAAGLFLLAKRFTTVRA